MCMAHECMSTCVYVEVKDNIRCLPLSFSTVVFIVSFTCIMFCLWICFCTVCISDACRGQKKVPDILELEWQTVMSHSEGAGTHSEGAHARVLWIAVSACNGWTISPATPPSLWDSFSFLNLGLLFKFCWLAEYLLVSWALVHKCEGPRETSAQLLCVQWIV